ncbi:MAG: SDR family NAD(P)-dependent oxidoreductase [Caldilinea sp.]
MQDKIVLITGGTGGIGKQVALTLAKMGAQVIVTGRNKVSGEAAVAEIKQASGNPNVELLLADLTKQSALRALVAEFKARQTRLDVLINNAGLAAEGRQVTEDGLDLRVHQRPGRDRLPLERADSRRRCRGPMRLAEKSLWRILADRPTHPAGTAGRFGSAGSGSRAAGNAADDEDRYRSAQGRVQWRMSALPQPHDNRMWVSPASGPESLTDPRSDENVTYR